MDGGFLAHPLPTWNNFLGKGEQRRWEVERAVPLAGIFFLNKRPRDRAEPMAGARAAVLLHDAARYKYRFALGDAPLEEMRGEAVRLFENACDAAQRLPAFQLDVSLEGRFWECMEGVPG
jgi:SynChlorMet cassette protein ScmC